MKPVFLALALLAASSATAAFAEGGGERLQQRSEQLAQQRQDKAQALAKRTTQPQEQVSRQARDNTSEPRS